MIYTDGSGFKGAIGVAVVAFTGDIKTAELCYQLGLETKHTVFEGELVAIILGLHLSWQVLGTQEHINLNIDNQATIKMMSNNCLQPAQYLIDKIKCDIHKLHREEKAKRIRQNMANQPEMEINLTWIAGHQGSIGNNAADELVKLAAEFGSSNTDLLPPFLCRNLPDNLSAVKQQISNNTKKETKVWWKRSKCYKWIKFIDSSLPSLKYIQVTNSLNCRQMSILMQLQIEHIPLNGHLFQINKTKSLHCNHCPNVVETVPHLLFNCNKYAFQRHRFAMAVKRKAFNVKHILSNPVAMWHMLNFVNSTRRLRRTYRDISAELMDENAC